MKENIVLAVLGAKYVHASLAPWCLAAGVKKYEPLLYDRVRIVEATINQTSDEVLSQIICKNPVIVGFSCYIWNIDATLSLCKALKQELPDLIIILGGPEVSYSVKEVFEENREVDYILTGEGEESFPAFLRAVFVQKGTLMEIPGLCGRRSDGSVYLNCANIPNEDVPSPVSAGYADAIQGRIAYFETSRGCPYRCAFCLSGSCDKPRYFDLDALLSDLLTLAVSGARTIKFVDRTFNANTAHANKILRFILANYGNKIPCGVCFHFEIAGDILREETLALLEQLPPGAVQLEIGIQSFFDKTLEAVNRKTDTVLLQSNIRRLVRMGNMHIHIDLIAGLPYESFDIFAESFNKAYVLGAGMLQLGFLKLLHGSDMRKFPQTYPCRYDKKAPYEVRETPWLSEQDIDVIHLVEDAVDRAYNSGRFRLTLNYVLNVSGLAPFDFYRGLGIIITERGISLDDYTALFQNYCNSLKNVDAETLRDFLVRDRLATNSSGGLPPCLYRKDARIAKASKKLSENPDTALKSGIRRNIAILYAANSLCFADYYADNKNPVTGCYKLGEIPLD